MTEIIAIDPGLHGAIAIIHTDGSAAVHDTPAGGGQYQLGSMRELLLRLTWDTKTQEHRTAEVYIEMAQAMPKQGVSSSFKTGFGVGCWEGMLVGLDLGYTRVSPSHWKGVMGVTAPGKTPTERKHVAVAAAQRLYPELSGSLLVSKDGRSEALLLARYGLNLQRPAA